MVLAFVSGSFLDHYLLSGYPRTLPFMIGIPLPFQTLFVVSATLAPACWFQPVALRLGLMRTTIWVVAYCLLGFWIVENLVGLFVLNRKHSLEMILYLHMCGLPGMLTIGARTRPWITFVAAVASFFLGPIVDVTGVGRLTSVMVGANLPYALLMLFGTDPIRTVSEPGKQQSGPAINATQ